MDYLWMDYDPDFYMTSREIEEEESRTDDEREIERTAAIDAEIDAYLLGDR